MLKINSEVFEIIVILTITTAISFLYTYLYEFLSRTQIEFIKSEMTIASIVLLMSIFILIQTVIRVNKLKNNTSAILVNLETNKILSLTLLIALLSIILFYFAYKANNLVFASSGIILVLLSINSFITHKSLSGISDTFIFHNGRQIPIKEVESYDIGSVYVYVRVTKSYLFVNTFEILSLSIKNNDLEKFEQIMNDHGKCTV